MTKKLHIAKLLDKKFAISQEDAEKISPSIIEAIQNKQILNLSFDSLETCSTIFLRIILGELYLAYGTLVDDYIKLVDIANDDEVLPVRLERLRRRALNPEVYKPIFEQALIEA
jgi:hypothetical protein